VILLDHNIPEHQRKLLQRMRLRPQQIGRDVGRPEWQDFDEILRYLHRLKSVTFITRDEDFFRRALCHSRYCIVVVDSSVLHTAREVQRFLRHADFRTKKQRLGKVVQLSSTGVIWWDLGQQFRQRQLW
jgi:predicted nuclease of predicted toxin-antitoxin system